jgi:3',5'-cyclic-AMP phosphodiesterase
MKFLYIADTHVGGSDIKGYRQQERYLKHFSELIDVFGEWIEQQGDVDFIIHGGDMVEKASLENIAEAGRLFNQLPCPLYFTPGNHDLTENDSVRDWLSEAPEFFNNESINFSFCRDNIEFDFISCHWGDKAYYWHPDETQIPYWQADQTDLISNEGDFKYKIVVTHAPVFGLPCEQTGLDEALHPPQGDFSSVVHELVKKHRTLLVLGAHTHMNMHLSKDGVHYVTGSAFSEMPFEFKVFELNDDLFSMETVSLADKLSFNGKYNFNKTYIQGRTCDRSFKETLK